jgi:hypothetical protein
MLGVVGALVVSGTAIAGTPQSQTLQTTLSPKKQDNKAFGGVSLHNIIKTQYDDFSGSPAARETVFNFGKDIKFTTGNLPACSQASLNAATSVAAVNVTCGRSVVGTGFNEVNNRTGAFTAQNPVVLVAGGPTTLYVWTRIAGGLTLVLNGRYSGHSLDVTGLPNTPGTDLTNFDTTMTKKRTGKSSFYVSARCSKKKKWVVTETTTYYNGQSLSASSTQKCKQK